MKIICYSAPAKIILSGEHAVVYGKPAIVAAIDMRLQFKVWESKLNNKNTDPNVLLIANTVKEYLKKNKITFNNCVFDYSIESDIPIKKRLGSSAAFAVAGVACLLELFTGHEWDKETINNLAYLIEKYFHSNASGVDTSTSCFGGLIFYRKEFEFLKTISSLNFKIPKIIDDNMYILDSGDASESTGEMVQLVGKMYNEKPQLTEGVLNDIEKTTKRMVVSIIKKDVEFFARCIIDNEIYLDMLGVVSDKAKGLLKKMESFGLGKVTGGGGKKESSGYLLFLTSNRKKLEEFCKKNKINFYKFRQSYTGLKKEL